MTATMPDRRAGPFERLAGWLKQRRDRLVADPAFQRFSASFPLTRGTAHRHASDLFDLCAGFVYSQVLFACVKLDLFAMLTRGPLPLADIAARCRLTPEAAERLVRAAIALKLLEWRGDTVGLGLKGAALTGNPGALAMVEHHAMLYADLADPIALLRGEAPPSHLRRFWAYGDGGSAEAAGPPPTTPRSWRARRRWWPTTSSTPIRSTSTGSCWMSVVATAPSSPRSTAARPRPNSISSTCRR